jgi:hypothetical protein
VLIGKSSVFIFAVVSRRPQFSPGMLQSLGDAAYRTVRCTNSTKARTFAAG